MLLLVLAAGGLAIFEFLEVSEVGALGIHHLAMEAVVGLEMVGVAASIPDGILPLALVGTVASQGGEDGGLAGS